MLPKGRDLEKMIAKGARDAVAKAKDAKRAERVMKAMKAKREREEFRRRIDGVKTWIDRAVWYAISQGKRAAVCERAKTADIADAYDAAVQEMAEENPGYTFVPTTRTVKGKNDGVECVDTTLVLKIAW